MIKQQILPHLKRALQEANTKINHMLPDRTADIKLKSRLNAVSKKRDQAKLRFQFYSEEVRRSAIPRALRFSTALPTAAPADCRHTASMSCRYDAPTDVSREVRGLHGLLVVGHASN
ncbi:hypothetical protein PsorP6_003311 [Peronosclerospora sorghi]|uniref:Uncharacterized protein n=1 Tax=Peronosclerospora sorghi TaxID=230839 RepID=A0ACC0VMN1_9STRA|nr:hypothetical protein PsorP6_003311 [Peronosclerospora sorghi]